MGIVTVPALGTGAGQATVKGVTSPISEPFAMRVGETLAVCAKVGVLCKYTRLLTLSPKRCWRLQAGLQTVRESIHPVYVKMTLCGLLL